MDEEGNVFKSYDIKTQSVHSYNERRHSSLQYLTPAQYYRGNPDKFLKTREIKIGMARMIRKERNMKERKGGKVAGASRN